MFTFVYFYTKDKVEQIFQDNYTVFIYVIQLATA